jgi:glycosyltransferase involved in cell wall biosynthesis
MYSTWLDNKRILQLVPSLNSGGVERTVMDMAQAIIKAGGQAHVATSGGRMVSELEKMGAQVHLLPLASKNPLTLYRNKFRLQKLMQTQKIDLVHARSRAPAWSGYLAARALHVPFITTYHGIYSGGRGFKEYYNRVMVKGLLTIANSHFTKAHILATHEVKDVRVVPRGVDVMRFTPQNAPENACFTFLMPARIARGKGFEVLFEAVSRLEGAFQVLVVGDGRETSYGQSLHPPPNVQFIGHVSDMREAYAACDAVLIPATRPEAFGRIAIEAGAMGKIAIGSNIGGLQETLQHDRTGYHVRVGDAQDLTDKMQDLMALSAAERVQMGKAARAYIVNHYRLDQMQEKTLAIYAEILKLL